MSGPIYLPGWFDQLNSDGSFSNLSNVLGRQIMPNFRANQDYQAMLKQDPGLLASLSNLPVDARQAFASSLGFKDFNKSPISQIQDSPKLKLENQRMNWLNSQPQPVVDSAMASSWGTQTAKELDRKDQEWDWTKQLKEFEVDTAKFNKDEQNFISEQRARSYTRLREAQAKYPNVNMAAVAQALTSDPSKVTPEIQEQLTVIHNDPELKDALQTIIEANQFNISSSLQKSRLFFDRGSQGLSAKLTFYSNIAARAQQRIDRFRGFIDKMVEAHPVIAWNPQKAFKADPSLKADYESLNKQYQDALKELDTANGLIGSVAGVKLPTNYNANDAAGGTSYTPSPAIQKMMADVKAGKLTRAMVEKSTLKGKLTQEDLNYLFGGR